LISGTGRGSLERRSKERGRGRGGEGEGERERGCVGGQLSKCLEFEVPCQVKLRCCEVDLELMLFGKK